MIVDKGTLFTTVQQQWKSKCDDQRYTGLAEVPGVTRENSILHAWHIGKRWSYGFL